MNRGKNVTNPYQLNVIDGEKDCSECLRRLPVDKFWVQKSHPSGFSSACKECLKARKKAKANTVLVEFQICAECGENKERSEYPKNHSKMNGLNSYCRKCSRAKSRKIYYQNVTKSREYQRTSYKRCDRFKKWSTGTYWSHTRRGIVFTFEKQELLELAQNTHNCMFCECKLKWEFHEGKKVQPNSPTLERLNCSDVCGINDIAIICHKCNTSKSNRKLNDYINYLEYILPKLKEIEKLMQITESVPLSV